LPGALKVSQHCKPDTCEAARQVGKPFAPVQKSSQFLAKPASFFILLFCSASCSSANSLTLKLMEEHANKFLMFLSLHILFTRGCFIAKISDSKPDEISQKYYLFKILSA